MKEGRGRTRGHGACVEGLIPPLRSVMMLRHGGALHTQHEDALVPMSPRKIFSLPRYCEVPLARIVLRTRVNAAQASIAHGGVRSRICEVLVLEVEVENVLGFYLNSKARGK